MLLDKSLLVILLDFLLTPPRSSKNMKESQKTRRRCFSPSIHGVMEQKLAEEMKS